MKLFSTLEIVPAKRLLKLTDKVVVLGSCFADNIGVKLSDAGIDACINPFGTLYNPVSVSNAIVRLSSLKTFDQSDCIEMGAGAGLICSFHHHSTFARKDAETFLKDANSSLEEASARWKEASVVIITLGTARCWCHNGEVVANCLKRPGYEFSRKMLSYEEVSSILRDIVLSHPDKHFIFTLSPVRHLGEGAHLNQLSKATLLLGLESVLDQNNTDYFPSYEIFLDELRDYRFCNEDLAHPTAQAIEYIWERFRSFAFLPTDLVTLDEAEKRTKQSRHRRITVL